MFLPGKDPREQSGQNTFTVNQAVGEKLYKIWVMRAPLFRNNLQIFSKINTLTGYVHMFAYRFITDGQNNAIHRNGPPFTAKYNSRAVAEEEVQAAFIAVKTTFPEMGEIPIKVFSADLMKDSEDEFKRAGKEGYLVTITPSETGVGVDVFRKL